MDKTTHQIRCERWLKIINECLASGMKKSQWCKANGISEKSFYYWQRILRNEAYMEAVGHNFYVFLNGETGEINVLYKRNDDNLGLIEVIKE